MIQLMIISFWAGSQERKEHKLDSGFLSFFYDLAKTPDGTIRVPVQYSCPARFFPFTGII